MKQISLGSKVCDTHTGFTGLATQRTERLYSCPMICIEGPLDKEGKIQAAQWFDEPRVEEIADEKPRLGFDRRMGNPAE